MANFASQLGRFLTAGSDAAKPFMLEEHRDAIAQKRDAKMQAYQTSEREATQAHQTSERAGAEAFATSQAGIVERAQGRRHEEVMTQREQQHGERMEQSEAQLDIQFADHARNMQYQADAAEATANYRADQLQIARDELEITKEGQSLANQVTQLTIDNAEDGRDAIKVLKDTEATQEQVDAAVRFLNLSTPEGRKITIIQMRDEDGLYVNDFAIFRGTDRIAGGPGGAAGGGPAQQQGQIPGVAYPTTPAEFEALDEGDEYFDPGDGKVHIKQTGNATIPDVSDAGLGGAGNAG